MRFSLKGILFLLVFLFVGTFVICYNAAAQSLGNAGTIQGTVVDPTGAAVPGAKVTVHNPVTGYSQEVTTGDDGSFKISNIPLNGYHLAVTAKGFATFNQDVDIRSTLPVQVAAKLGLAGSETTVNVEANSQDILEVDPTAHTDAGHHQLELLPINDPGAGLSKSIIYTTGGVADDGNGFFHPLGDHAQVLFVIDNQPISDQQSKVFSTQLPLSAVESMELDTGSVNAEFGDKTSLIAQVTTKSGLGKKGFFGSISGTYGTFGTDTGSLGLGWGNNKVGNFFAA